MRQYVKVRISAMCQCATFPELRSISQRQLAEMFSKVVRFGCFDSRSSDSAVLIQGRQIRLYWKCRQVWNYQFKSSFACGSTGLRHGLEIWLVLSIWAYLLSRMNSMKDHRNDIGIFWWSSELFLAAENGVVLVRKKIAHRQRSCADASKNLTESAVSRWCANSYNTGFLK